MHYCCLKSWTFTDLKLCQFQKKKNPMLRSGLKIWKNCKTFLTWAIGGGWNQQVVLDRRRRLQEWGGFEEKGSISSEETKWTNTPTAGHGPEHFHATGWGCEQMQLWFIWGWWEMIPFLLHHADNGHSMFYQLQMPHRRILEDFGSYWFSRLLSGPRQIVDL